MTIKIEKPSNEEIDYLGVKDWPIWECEPSEFLWHYDVTETCYLIEGKVMVVTDNEEVEFSEGDMVTFPKGLSCTWKVEKKVRKHYKFED